MSYEAPAFDLLREQYPQFERITTLLEQVQEGLFYHDMPPVTIMDVLTTAIHYHPNAFLTLFWLEYPISTRALKEADEYMYYGLGIAMSKVGQGSATEAEWLFSDVTNPDIHTTFIPAKQQPTF